MELSQRFVRKHLERIHPFTKACSLEATRRGQDLLGNVLAKTMRTNVNIVPVDHPKLSGNVEPCACFAIPHDELKRGVILYLHGGGYTLNMQRASGPCWLPNAVFGCFVSLTVLRPKIRFLLHWTMRWKRIAICFHSATSAARSCLQARVPAADFAFRFV